MNKAMEKAKTKTNKKSMKKTDFAFVDDEERISSCTFADDALVLVVEILQPTPRQFY